MKYIISEDQLKTIIEAFKMGDKVMWKMDRNVTQIVDDPNRDWSEWEPFKYKGKVNMVHVYLNLPFPKNPTRDTHPHLYKTKYTEHGHPIPTKTPKINYVTLVNPNTDEIYGAKYPDSENATVSCCLSPDKELYVFTGCDNSGVIQRPLCLGHINKSYVTSWVNANQTFDEEELINIENKFLELFEKGNIIELVIKEEI